MSTDLSHLFGPETRPSWLAKSDFDLLADAVWGGESFSWRLRRVFRQISRVFSRRNAEQKIRALNEQGLADTFPSLAQLWVASRDQILISAIDETKIFYDHQGIPWNFHNFRRFVAAPATMLDPIGLLSDEQTIIEHTLQTYHRDPVYDMGLLYCFESGIDHLIEQLESLLRGAHPQGRALLSLIEDATYHERLLIQARSFKENPGREPLSLPRDLNSDPILMAAMDQFKDVKGTFRYASRLQVTPLGAFFEFLLTPLNRKRATLKLHAIDPDIRSRYDLKL